MRLHVFCSLMFSQIFLTGCYLGGNSVSSIEIENVKGNWLANRESIYEESDMNPGIPLDLPPICVFEGQTQFAKSTVEIINLTETTRRLTGVRKGCGCTDVEFEPTPIEPQSKATLRISVALSGLSSLESRSISLKPLLDNGNCLSLRLQVSCIPRFALEENGKLKPAKALGRHFVSEGKVSTRHRLHLLSENLDQLKELNVNKICIAVLPVNLSATLSKSGDPQVVKTINGTQIYSIPCDLDIFGEVQKVSDDISGLTYSVQIIGTEAGFFDTICFGTVEKRLAYIQEPKFVLLRQGEDKRFSIRSVENRPFSISSVTVDTDSLIVERQSEGAREEHVLSVSRSDVGTKSNEPKRYSVQVMTSSGENIRFLVVFIGR